LAASVPPRLLKISLALLARLLKPAIFDTSVRGYGKKCTVAIDDLGAELEFRDFPLDLMGPSP
jgi:hypothetical protein